MPLSNNPSEVECSTSNSQDSCLVEIEENPQNAENHVPQALPVIPQDALNVIIKYHLDGEGHTSLSREVIKQSGLFAIAIFGVMFYYVPAKAYAESICADPNYKEIPCDFFVINHLLGTMLVAGGILMTATNAFFDQLQAEYIPLKLVEYLKHPLSPQQKALENVVTFAGSFIASIPFMIITVVNPIPGLPKLFILSQALIVGVTNTLLHLLPFKLALKNRWYRTPFLPIEFIFQSISNALLSMEEKQEQALQEQINQHYQMIKQQLINHHDLALRLLSIYGFSFTGCGYTNEAINDIRDIQAVNQSPLQLLTQLLDYLHQISPDRSISPPSRINNFFRKVIYFPGASWVILACSGFWVGTFNEMSRLTGNSASGAALSAPSIYCLGVLLAFFGGNALQTSYDYLTAWEFDSVKISSAFKPYPKTSVLLIMISIYLSAFSYAAGAQLINDNFTGKLAFLRPYLLDLMLKLAKTGLIFLGSTAMIDFVKHVLRKFEQYGGDEDVQTVAKLFEAFSQMKDSIQLMKPRLLLNSLAQANENQLNTILNIRDKNDLQNFSETLVQLAENLKTKLLKKCELLDLADLALAKLIKLFDPLQLDQVYTVEKVETILIYFNTELQWNELSLSLKKVYRELKEISSEYKAVCELIHKLDSVNVLRERKFDTFSGGSINNDDNYAAGSSIETTPLLEKRTPPQRIKDAGGSVHGRFFLHHARSSFSPMDLSTSTQLGM
ncbi:MAG: hypothetical protein WAL30_05065 [Candidatus Aquirickettsiella sp.]